MGNEELQAGKRPDQQTVVPALPAPAVKPPAKPAAPVPARVAAKPSPPSEVKPLTQEQLDALEQKRTSFQPLLRAVCRATMPHRILEWGPGDSTLFMVDECAGAKILSIEHDPLWLKRATERMAGGGKRETVRGKYGCTHLRVRDSDIVLCYRVISMKGGESNGYVTWPLWLVRHKADDVMPSIGDGFHLIFVDGRFRLDCLMVASLVLAPDGVVVVHDANRINYHAAWDAFKYRHYDEDARTCVLSNQPLDFLKDKKPGSGEIWWTARRDKDTLEEMERRITSKQPFSYVRFGDADLLFVSNPWFNENRRHQPKTTRFSEELNECLKIDDPNFLIGCAAFSGWGNPEKVVQLRRIAGRFYHRKEFWSATFLHVLFTQDFPRFKQFLGVFQGRKVNMIGGEKVCLSPEVRKAFNVGETISLTDTNAYDVLEPRMAEIEALARRSDILVSALGQTTRIVAKRLWNKGIRNLQYFDVGSVVDALAGAKTRSWITKNNELVEAQRKEFQ